MMKAAKNHNFQHSRASIPVLVIHSNGQTSNQLRQALKTMGFNSVTAAPSHVAAIDRIRSRDFALVMFEAKATDMPALDFVKQALGYDENMVLVPISAEPRVDDVFGMLQAGARGFLVIPFTVDTLETVVMSAAEGPALNEAVLSSPDRNGALVGVILNNLYKTAVLQRQAREFPTAARELERQQIALVESVELARLFCEGTDQDLTEKIIEGCIHRANTASTRLGRTRKKLQRARAAEGQSEILQRDELTKASS